MLFEDLKLIEPILIALKEKKYTEATPIQAQAIPHIIKGHDVLGCAQTGTGKTAAFAIPIIQKLELNREKSKYIDVKALIITPTRELAIQIDENFTLYAKHTKIKNTVIFGGVKQGAQVKKLNQGVDILVATPGRLLDLMDQGYINLEYIEFFVLDEADRMLDMGFIHDIKKIIAKLPKRRQSLFFSATMPKNIVELSRTILYNPVKIEVAVVSSTADTITQFIYYTNKATKKNLLWFILENKDLSQVLIFSRTKHGADKVVRHLAKKNISAAAIHGDKAQNTRQRALNDFKEGKIRVLVATDIAARGIDIAKLQYVINYDVPNIPETYVHRIGRSGRAGLSGIAISMCDAEENAYVKDIQKLIGKKITVIDENPFPQTDNPMNDREKKDFEKQKQKAKQDFFATRKKNEQASSKSSKPKRNFKGRKSSSSKPKSRS